MNEWETEPNEATFIEHGYWCEIKRHKMMGTLCGYVLVGRHHPYANTGYDVPLEVHGGVTFNDGVRIGFDCAHAGDLVPGRDLAHSDDVYRNMAYVKAECKRLAEQLRAVDPITNIKNLTPSS
jgi:hypothetical protein